MIGNDKQADSTGAEKIEPLSLSHFETSKWQDLIVGSAERTCLHYSELFGKRLIEAEKAGDAVSSCIFRLLMDLTFMHLDSHSAEHAYRPRVQGRNQRSAIPGDISPADAALLSDLSLTVTDPEMRARLADLGWILTRKYAAAEGAIKAYLESASNLEDPKHWIDSAHRIERASRLAAQLQRKDLIDRVAEHVEDVLDRRRSDYPFHLASYLLDLLIEVHRGDPAKYAGFADECATKAESSNDFETARDFWTIKSKWLLLARNQAARRDAQIAAAETYAKKANLLDAAGNPPNYMLITDLLERGLQAHRLIPGQAARVNELRQRLLAVQPKALDQLKPISLGEFNATELIEKAVDRVRGKSFPDALVGIASIADSPEIETLREHAIENMKLAPLVSSLPSVVVSSSGKTVAKTPSAVSSDEDEKEVAIVHAMRWELGLFRGIAAVAIVAVRDQTVIEHPVLLRDWSPLVLNNPFIPPGREQIFAEGLHAGLTGNLMVAVHLLIPQIENSFREILRRHNVIPSKLNKDGIEEERHIQDLLYMKEFKQVFGAALTFDLTALLVDHGGPNLRHETAHGLKSYDEFTTPDALYFWCLTLRLCIPLFLQRLLARAASQESKAAQQ